MSHTYASILLHCVWSTRSRLSLITPELDERIHPYMGGIARENGFGLIRSGGTENHVHLLLTVPPSMAPCKAVQLIKGGSSKWVHDTFPQMKRTFGWQEGYGVFSISVSGVDRTIAYIDGQKTHHRRRTFEEEYQEFLDAHMIEYKDDYVFG